MRIAIGVLLFFVTLICVRALIDFHYMIVSDVLAFGISEAINLGVIILLMGVCCGMMVMHWLERWHEVRR